MPEGVAEFPETIAIVGAGPAGLTAAFYLRGAGSKVTLFDRESEAGGIMHWGIPEFRLPLELVGVACLVACRAVPRRAALLPALVAGALFLAPSAFGQTGLFLHGAAVAAAGAAATLLFGRKAA